MSWRPNITTAIPKRRYQFGEFTAVLLGDIETPDVQTYHYILAIVKEGTRSPDAYIVSQSTPENGPQIVVLANSGAHLIQTTEAPLDLESFSELALEGMRQMFELHDEIPARLF